MTKTQSTKEALITGIISMVLSCVMLFGTTFAWFTDNVSSKSNRILAGNLDIDLLMYKADNGKYVSIKDGSGDIFAEANGKDVCWEPDRTEIVYLAVENTGTLSVKYSMKLHIEGELSGVLEYAILNGEKAKSPTVTNWADIKRESGQIGNLKTGLIPVIDNGKLDEKDDTEYLAIAVHMPADTENYYQEETITVDLTLAATQGSYEKDSFGDNYDIGADITEKDYTNETEEISYITIKTTKEFIEFADAVNSGGTYRGISVANNPDICVKLADDIDLSEYTDFSGIGNGKNNFFNGIFDGCNHIIKNYDSKAALFTDTNGIVIKNLTIDSFDTVSETADECGDGILIGKISGGDTLIDNVTVKNSSITGEETVGVIVGEMTEGYLKITDCNVENVTIKNAEGHKDTVGVLLGMGYSEKDYDESGFSESDNKIANVIWLSGDEEQEDIPSYNYTK